jgi:hypothetical protein
MKPPAESAEALCARALEGERAAWQALILLHSRRVLVSLLAQKLPGALSFARCAAA